MSSKKRIVYYVVAGEASGDAIGAKLMKALKLKQSEKSIEFYGIGGHGMQKEGLKRLLFPMEELSVMGLMEVVPNVWNIRKRLYQTFSDIKQTKPHVIITIDSKGFSFRLHKLLQKHQISGTRIHYVGPSLWAYKNPRKPSLPFLDHLFLLLPFEPVYFKTIPCTFVGHPVLEDYMTYRKGYDSNKNEYPIDRCQPKRKQSVFTICILPGSRKQEVVGMLGIIEKAIKQLQGPIQVIAFTLASLRPLFNELTIPCTVYTDSSIRERFDRYQQCDLAIATSGTVVMETSVMQLRTIVVYKTHWLTEWIIKRLANVRYVSLINILADQELIQELIFEQCTSEALVQAIQEPSKPLPNIEDFYPSLVPWKNGRPLKPSHVAAEKIVQLLD